MVSMPHRSLETGTEQGDTRELSSACIWPDYVAVRLQRMLMEVAHCSTDEECMHWIMQYAAPLRERFLQGEGAAALLEQFEREPDQVVQQIQQSLYH